MADNQIRPEWVPATYRETTGKSLSKKAVDLKNSKSASNLKKVAHSGFRKPLKRKAG